MVMNKKNILFYFIKGDSDGGSDYSLFVHLVHLDLTKYNPIIIYRKKSQLTANLAKKGYKLLHIPGKVKKIQQHTNTIRKSKNKEYLFKKYLRSIKVFYKAIPEALKLRKIIKDEKINLIHLNHNLNGDRAGIIAGILTRIKIISHYRGLYKPIPIDLFLAKFIDKIICISDFTKDEYISTGIDENKCITIHNGVDTSIFKPSSKLSSDTIVGCIGRLEYWKGQHVLIKAIPEVLKVFPSIKFQFIGDGNNKDNLILLVKELKVEHAVEFVGSVNNIEKYIKEFSLAVHTSIEPEPFGRVIIEAMAMGKVVISTNIGGPKEIISNGINGYLIPPNRPNTLSLKIIEILQSIQLNKKISQEANKAVKARFEAKLITQKIERLYRQITEQRGIA